MSNTVPHHVIEEAQQMANKHQKTCYVLRRPGPGEWRVEVASEFNTSFALIADYVVEPEVQK